MSKTTIEQLQRHIKTHSERSEEDRSAVATLKSFLTPGGKINDVFSSEDKWSNNNIPILLTAIDVKGSDLRIISRSDNTTRICFTVYPVTIITNA